MLTFTRALTVEDFSVFSRPWRLTRLGLYVALVLKVQFVTASCSVLSTVGPSRHTVAMPAMSPGAIFYMKASTFPWEMKRKGTGISLCI